MIQEEPVIFKSSPEEILQSARELRAEGKIQESYDLVRKNLGQNSRYAQIIWQHRPIFWRDLRAGKFSLTRRRGSDANFIRQLWADKKFIDSFHRLAGKLPDKLSDLQTVLDNEYSSLIKHGSSIHWVIRDSAGKPWGILSLTNISLTHQRAEVLLGVIPGAPFGMATAAMLILFNFYFNGMKFQKLYTLTYDDNVSSNKGVLHLGFKIEGRLRNHVRYPGTGKFLDLVQAGLLAEEAFTLANLRLIKKLL
jgi:RimJ/RimL family protein N-acetyltransferase